MSQVNIKVQSELRKILEDLERITAAGKQLEAGLGNVGKDVEDGLEKTNSRIERFLNETRSLGARVAKQLKGDFQALFALNATAGALKLSNQFAGTIKETISLSDTIRKLGQTFGIASSNFASFQGKITKGLGDVGLSSDVATQSLSALADTPVRGEENLVGYSKAAGELASIGREQGQEGTIAKGIADVITARGGNPNDLKQVNAVAEDLRRVFNQTGKQPSQTLASMQQIFAAMPPDLRKAIGTRGLANLAAAGQVAGPGSTKFIEELLSRSPIARQALNAQGFGKVFNNNGLDVERFRKASQSILGRIGFDPTQAAKTLGISDEAAQGFVRLAESLDKVKNAQQGIAKQTGDLNTEYLKNRGLLESYRASFNKIKGFAGGIFGHATQGATDLLGKASQSTLGSAAVVGGSGLLAALLAGGGLRGLGKSLFGTAAKGAVAEQLTGKEVQPVYVVNASEINGGGGAGAADVAAAAAGKGGLEGTLGKVAGGVGALAGGYELGNVLKQTKLGGEISDAIANAIVKGIQKIPGLGLPDVNRSKQHVHVELNKPELRVRAPLTRGAIYK